MLRRLKEAQIAAVWFTMPSIDGILHSQLFEICWFSAWLTSAVGTYACGNCCVHSMGLKLSLMNNVILLFEAIQIDWIFQSRNCKIIAFLEVGGSQSIWTSTFTSVQLFDEFSALTAIDWTLMRFNELSARNWTSFSGSPVHLAEFEPVCARVLEVLMPYRGYWYFGGWARFIEWTTCTFLRISVVNLYVSSSVLTVKCSRANGRIESESSSCRWTFLPEWLSLLFLQWTLHIPLQRCPKLLHKPANSWPFPKQWYLQNLLDYAERDGRGTKLSQNRNYVSWPKKKV